MCHAPKETYCLNAMQSQKLHVNKLFHPSNEIENYPLSYMTVNIFFLGLTWRGNGGSTKPEDRNTSIESASDWRLKSSILTRSLGLQ